MEAHSKQQLLLLSCLGGCFAAVLFILFLVISKPVLISTGLIRLSPPSGGLVFVPSDFQLLFPTVSAVLVYVCSVAIIAWMLAPEGIAAAAIAVCMYVTFYAVLMLTLPSLDSSTSGTLLVPDWQMIGAQFRSAFILQLMQIAAGSVAGLLLGRLKRNKFLAR
jgi:hypothetical protein